MINKIFEELQNWYYSQCDNDWEHEFGIKIDTLDNPGWKVIIDIKGTELDHQTFKEINSQKDKNDWIQCEVKDSKFIGVGGPKNLVDIIKIFIDWSRIK